MCCHFHTLPFHERPVSAPSAIVHGGCKVHVLVSSKDLFQGPGSGPSWDVSWRATPILLCLGLQACAGADIVFHNLEVGIPHVRPFGVGQCGVMFLGKSKK